MNFKKTFLNLFIITLLSTAIIGILLLSLGTFDDFQVKILFTSLSLMYFSLTGLCASSSIHIRFKKFSFIGVTISVISFLINMFAIWFEIGDLLKVIFTGMILSLAFAHISILFMLEVNNKMLLTFRFINISTVTIISFLLILLVSTDSYNNLLLLRFIGIFSILVIISGAAIPLLKKLEK